MFFVFVSFLEMVKDIVFIGGDNEMFDREIYVFGEVFSKDVVEVVSGDDEVDLVVDFKFGV